MLRLLAYLLLLALAILIVRTIAPVLIIALAGLLVLAWKRPAVVSALTGRPQLARVPGALRATPMRFAASAAVLGLALIGASSAVGGESADSAQTAAADVQAPASDALTPATAEPTARPTAEPTARATPRPTPKPTLAPAVALASPVVAATPAALVASTPAPVVVAPVAPVPAIPVAVATPVPFVAPAPVVVAPAYDASYPGANLLVGVGDYDCAGGSGDGPNYVAGPITVLPPDPFDLDRDGNGIGCEG